MDVIIPNLCHFFFVLVLIAKTFCESRNLQLKPLSLQFRFHPLCSVSFYCLQSPETLLKRGLPDVPDPALFFLVFQLPVSNLDSLTCTSTWIEAEREEFEAEKLAVREGQPVEPPPSWVYSDLKIEPNVPFFGPNYLDCFAEPSPAEDFTALSNFQPSSSSPAYTLEPSSEDSTSSRISVQSRTSEAGKIKLLIKRPKEVAKQDLPGSSSDEVPKKISLKFKISAKKLVPVPKGDAEGKDRDVLVKEEVDGTLAASVDVATQSAVESILQLNRSDRSVIGVVKQEEPRNTPLSGSLVRRPVIGNGSVFNENYFYGTQNFVETDTEDPGLDEAIQSILG